MCVPGVLLLLGFGAAVLLLGSYAAAAVVKMMYASTVAAFFLSKVPTYQPPFSFVRFLNPFMICPLIAFFQVMQALTNYHNGHTGQLSTLSELLHCIGSLGAAVVSVQVCNWKKKKKVKPMDVLHFSIIFVILTLALWNFSSFRRVEDLSPLCLTYCPRVSALC